MISIELLLDPETEERVRADWAALATAGMSSMGAHRSESNRPHVTLLVRRDLAHISFHAARERLPVIVDLTEPVVFEYGERGVLAWRVEPSPTLIELHRAVHNAALPGEDAPHTAPGEWTPHITLARRLRLDTLPAALSVLGASQRGSATGLRRWDSESKIVVPL